MNKVTIKIQSLEDAKVERQVMPELTGKAVVNATNVTVCILEDMTASHKAGVSIVFENPDGTFTTSLITEGNFDGVVAAYNGAKERFKMLREKRIADQN